MTAKSPLPVELLLQIFSYDLSTADLARCAQTCRQFYNIVSQCNINYTFKIDHPSLSTWRLIRCLLKNPKLGERFQSIKVTWHRRVPRKPKTWALKWSWSPEELDELERVCKRWHIFDVQGIPEDYKNPRISSLFYAIEFGMNSEVLLPLLLCYTTRLESLDYGQTALYVVYPRCTFRERIRMFKYCEGDASKWEPRDRNDNGREYWNACWQFEVNHNSWFYHTLNLTPQEVSRITLATDQPPKVLPGLSSLKHFSHRGWRFDNHWPNIYLQEVLLLPNIESARFYVVNPYKLEQPRVPEKPEFPSDKKSKVKRLELINSLHHQNAYEQFARSTGSLESLKIILEDGFVSFKLKPGSTTLAECLETMVSAFLDNNERLDRSKVSITTGPAPVREDEDTEGSDDDPYYYGS